MTVTVKEKKSVKPAPKPAAQTGASTVGFNKMNMFTIVAAIYKTVHSAILEYVQNSIDEGAEYVTVDIDMRGNRSISIRDNGRGCTKADFSKHISELGASIKPDNPEYNNASGQIGIGICAFFGKAEYITFTSAPKEGKSGKMVYNPLTQQAEKQEWEGYTRHAFHEIYEKDGNPQIPMYTMSELNKTPEWWMSSVDIKGIMKGTSHFTINLNTLEKDIRERFSETMRSNKTTVIVNYVDTRGKSSRREIKPTQYTGEPIKYSPKSGEYCGRVRFDLYKLNSPRGSVVIQPGGTGFTLPWKDISAQVIRNGLEKEVVDGLSSGYFEGIIQVEKCHVMPSRDGLLEGNDDGLALVELLLQIRDWMREVGFQHLKYLNDEQKQLLENEALKSALVNIKTMGLDILADPLSAITGAVSPEHTALPDGVPTINARTEPSTPTGEATPRKVTVDPKPRGEQEKKIHISAGDPDGRPRTRSATQPGILAVLSDMKGSRERTRYSEELGCWEINRRHTDFLACRDTGKAQVLSDLITKFLELGLTKLLMSESSHEDWSLAEDQLMKFFLFKLLGEAKR